MPPLSCDVSIVVIQALNTSRSFRSWTRQNPVALHTMSGIKPRLATADRESFVPDDARPPPVETPDVPENYSYSGFLSRVQSNWPNFTTLTSIVSHEDWLKGQPKAGGPWEAATLEAFEKLSSATRGRDLRDVKSMIFKKWSKRNHVREI